MDGQTQRTFILPAAEAGYLDAQVESGAYGSAEDVLLAGLRALRERDESEQWLRDEILPVADALEADPSLAIPMEEVFADLRALHKTWVDERSH